LIDYSITRQQSIATNSESILWTPRWTTEEIYGGTTFFAYKDKILTLKAKHPNIELVLRPHPFTFQHALNLGKMTERDIENYKKSVKEHGASFDKNEMVGDTFRKTGILITDYS
jgi:CDP-glycerol glycerophosphotransferase (TagB/SpsB family)